MISLLILVFPMLPQTHFFKKRGISLLQKMCRERAVLHLLVHSQMAAAESSGPDGNRNQELPPSFLQDWKDLSVLCYFSKPLRETGT